MRAHSSLRLPAAVATVAAMLVIALGAAPSTDTVSLGVKGRSNATPWVAAVGSFAESDRLTFGPVVQFAEGPSVYAVLAATEDGFAAVWTMGGAGSVVRVRAIRLGDR